MDYFVMEPECDGDRFKKNMLEKYFKSYNKLVTKFINK